MRFAARFLITSLSMASFLVLLISLTLSADSNAASRDKERWNSKYSTEKYLFGKRPIAFLQEHVALLPKGTALDIAMGEGRNGVFLATKGYEVTGVDISEKGLEKARRLAADHGVAISTKVVDLESYQLEKNAYDVILCTYYLQRDLFPQIKSGVKPGGMVVIETYTMGHRKYRPRFRKEYLLHDNELLDIFRDFKIIRYQNVDDGKAAYESILAQKP